MKKLLDILRRYSTKPHYPKIWKQFNDDVYFIRKLTHLENFFHHINNSHQKIKYPLEKESIVKLILFTLC